LYHFQETTKADYHNFYYPTEILTIPLSITIRFCYDVLYVKTRLAGLQGCGKLHKGVTDEQTYRITIPYITILCHNENDLYELP